MFPATPLSVPLANDVNKGLFRKLVMMMQTDPTEKGLVLSILDNSADPTPRRIYADWLEEHGRDDEATAEREAAKILEKPPPPTIFSSGYATLTAPFSPPSLSGGFYLRS